MVNLRKIFGLAGALVLAAPSAAFADGFQSWRVCGQANASAFVTCAAVEVSVVGADVTMRVWNFAGDLANSHGVASDPGGIITGIGLYNVPPGVDAVLGSLNETGPVRPGDTPGKWKLENNGRVDFIVDISGNANGNTGNNGIASSCATPAQLPGPPVELYMNPCGGNLNNGADWVTFKFKITGGPWDPSTADLSIRTWDAVQNMGSECRTGNYPPNPSIPPTCFTITPEPVSMSLLATGLAGMGGLGGLGIFRRKKEK